MRKDDDLKVQIIRAGFAIGAIRVAPGMNKLFAGPHGQAPILNDTRLHISYPEDRKMILTAFKRLITPDMEFDAIVGTTTAGIAWATLLAQELHKPLVLMHNSQMCGIEIPEASTPEEVRAIEAHSVIAGIGPLAIPQAAVLAHAFDKGMIYVRMKSSSFGNPIEGAYTEGQKVLLVQNNPFSQKTEQGERELRQACLPYTTHRGTTCFTTDLSVRGKKLLVIDDLITHGHSIDEILRYQNLQGAQISQILCIFDQSKQSALSRIQENNLSVAPIATYKDILAVAVIDEHIPKNLLPSYLLWQTSTHWIHEAGKLKPKKEEVVES